jgi:hypothetical protein
MTIQRQRWVVAWLMCSLGCADTTQMPVSAAEAPPSQGQSKAALAGIEGTLEFALDAPWRMEPVPNVPVFDLRVEGQASVARVWPWGYRYDPVPIQVTIHDADRVNDDTGGGSSTTVGRVCGLSVASGATATYIPLEQFQEVERSSAWPTAATVAPSRRVCSRTATSNCAGEAQVGGTAEWHGLVLYSPPVAPSMGSDLPLTLTLKVTRSPLASCADISAPVYTLINEVRVHYGEAPLPRFAGSWAYGDFHYHSQGTDNEGESGYNYRGVSRAMKAIGLDLLWATEHASASEQVMDVDLSYSFPDDVEIKAKLGTLRDMNDARFRTMQAVVNAANDDSVRRHAGSTLVPQIFLGGEIDAVPELGPVIPPNFTYSYAGSKTYDIRGACGGWRGNLQRCNTSNCESGSLLCCDAVESGSSTCSLQPNGFTEVGAGGTLLMKDIQGINQVGLGREHMVYLPDPSRADAFVASFTSRYGGGQRQLVESRSNALPGLLPEIESKGGSVFIAHHLNGGGGGGEGPDGIPWTKSMLEKAWRQQSVLGLEFWNENTRRKASPLENTGYERDDTIGPFSSPARLVDEQRKGLRAGEGVFALRPFNLATGQYTELSSEVEKMLVDGAFAWDELNLKGLDPSQTQTLAWLPSGQPRKFFIAAGSDGHGDFNYRREGYFEGTTKITDTALGTPRNLIQMPSPSSNGAYPPAAALSAIRAGHFAATDGPALRIVADLNRNGVVDANEPGMGDVVDFDFSFFPADYTVPLLVDWASTPEFGNIERIELTVGVYGDRAAGGVVSRDTRTYTGGCNFLDCTLSNQAPVTSTDGWSYRLDSRGYGRVTPAGAAPDSYLSAQLRPAVMTGAKAFNLDLRRLPTYPGGIKTTPRRVFVRAIAITDRLVDRNGTWWWGACLGGVDSLTGQCIRRYALTNPMWARTKTQLVFQ